MPFFDVSASALSLVQ
ncbi:hypothetical protein BSLA_02f4032, partial [Burkholderia stabilis]